MQIQCNKLTVFLIIIKVLAILYDGGKAAEEEPRLLGTTENRLGIESWLKSQGHEFIGEIAHSCSVAIH